MKAENNTDMKDWIPIKDRLPEKDCNVMVKDSDSLTPEKELSYVAGQFLYIAYGVALDYTHHVTHWKHK